MEQGRLDRTEAQLAELRAMTGLTGSAEVSAAALQGDEATVTNDVQAYINWDFGNPDLDPNVQLASLKRFIEHRMGRAGIGVSGFELLCHPDVYAALTELPRVKERLILNDPEIQVDGRRPAFFILAGDVTVEDCAFDDCCAYLLPDCGGRVIPDDCIITVAGLNIPGQAAPQCGATPMRDPADALAPTVPKAIAAMRAQRAQREVEISTRFAVQGIERLSAQLSDLQGQVDDLQAEVSSLRAAAAYLTGTEYLPAKPNDGAVLGRGWGWSVSGDVTVAGPGAPVWSRSAEERTALGLPPRRFAFGGESVRVESVWDSRGRLGFAAPIHDGGVSGWVDAQRDADGLLSVVHRDTGRTLYHGDGTGVGLRKEVSGGTPCS